MNRLHTGLLTLLALAGYAGAAEKSEPATPLEPQVSIPFVNHGGVRDWQANQREGVWIQDVHKTWYYAKTLGPCMGLDFAQSLAFDTQPSGTLDRFSAILVPGEQRCALTSLAHSAGPPVRPKKPAKSKPLTVKPDAAPAG